MAALRRRRGHSILPLWLLSFLWPPNKAGHYIFALWFVSTFFPRLFSAVGDWMSTILPDMMWF